nr:response regulator transcription factor [Geodermatophilus ruber]
MADDDPRVRRALDAALSEVEDLEVLGVCGSAAELCRCATAHRPDIVLLDVHLPDAAAGLGLIGALTRARVPVVAMSAVGGVRGASLAAGAVAFVEKDGAADTLVDALFAAGQGPP